jgi:hypothetical protein
LDEVKTKFIFLSLKQRVASTTPKYQQSIQTQAQHLSEKY